MKYAALFPGQGSQMPGMALKQLNSSLAREIFDAASETLGFDIKKMCTEADGETLKLTANAQPCIYTVSYISYRLFIEDYKTRPVFAAGHSLGEYTALAAADVYEFTEGLTAVRKRGLFMQEAVPVGIGAMAAVLGADAAELTQACKALSDRNGSVAPANFNCPGQIVISGHKDKVSAVLEKFKGKLLEVSAPFHCQLMQPARMKMDNVLKEIQYKNAQFPVISNTDNKTRTVASDFAPSLSEQITGAVKWDTGIQKIIADGITHFIEFGAGNILSGLMKRIDRNVKIINFHSLEDVSKLSEFNR